MTIGTVLHVDDSKDMRELVRRAFVKADGEVSYLGTGSGREALDLLSGELAGRRLLLLLDLDMPEMSGIELLEALQQQGLRSRFPVVMLTASEDAEDERTCLAHGVDRFCRKPGELADLLTLARQLAGLLRQAAPPAG
jgi:CheY-like chemotaxis protein